MMAGSSPKQIFRCEMFKWLFGGEKKPSAPVAVGQPATVSRVETPQRRETPWPVVVDRSFVTKIVGVSHENDDGSSRQALLMRLSLMEELVLAPEPHNPVSPGAVKVCRLDGAQLGYLPEGSVRLDMIASGFVAAQLHKVTTPYGDVPWYGATITLTVSRFDTVLRPLAEPRMPASTRVKTHERLKYGLDAAGRMAVMRKSGTTIGFLDLHQIELKALETRGASLEIATLTWNGDAATAPEITLRIYPF